MCFSEGVSVRKGWVLESYAHILKLAQKDD